MQHVAWSCDGRRLAAVGMDKTPRVWVPEKSVSWTHRAYAPISEMLSLTGRWICVRQPHLREAMLMMSTMFHGTQHTRSFSAARAREIEESYSGIPDVRIIIPFACQQLTVSTETRYVQQVPLKVSPIYTSYAPSGKHLLYASTGQQIYFLAFGRGPDGTRDEWRIAEKEPVCANTSLVKAHSTSA